MSFSFKKKLNVVFVLLFLVIVVLLCVVLFELIAFAFETVVFLIDRPPVLSSMRCGKW